MFYETAVLHCSIGLQCDPGPICSVHVHRCRSLEAQWKDDGPAPAIGSMAEAADSAVSRISPYISHQLTMGHSGGNLAMVPYLRI
jgi:hypothetical protein